MVNYKRFLAIMAICILGTITSALSISNMGYGDLLGGYSFQLVVNNATGIIIQILLPALILFVAILGKTDVMLQLLLFRSLIDYVFIVNLYSGITIGIALAGVVTLVYVIGLVLFLIGKLSHSKTVILSILCIVMNLVFSGIGYDIINNLYTHKSHGLDLGILCIISSLMYIVPLVSHPILERKRSPEELYEDSKYKTHLH